MNNQEQQKIQAEIEFKKKQFINEVSLVSQILGVEVDFYMRTNEKGHIIPYMHLGVIEKLNEEKKKEYIEVINANRIAWMKMLGFQDTAIEPKEWSDRHITKEILESDPEVSFMKVLDMVEREYQMTMKPVVVGSQDGIVGSYDIIEKTFAPSESVEKTIANNEKSEV